jgi:kynurenine formamidase
MADWIWLSHVTSSKTPAYGNGKNGFVTSADKKIGEGDSCNMVSIRMSNHIGSHVDAPRHFIEDGATIEQFDAGSWVFEKPLLIDLPMSEGNIIDIDDVVSSLDDNVVDADLVLMRTGIEAFREQERFWKKPPGFSPELRSWLAGRFASFNALGMDAISISSFAHRDTGREAHREFLGHGIRIFEDLALAGVAPSKRLRKVVALPFRFSEADGAPATLIGDVVSS